MSHGSYLSTSPSHYVGIDPGHKGAIAVLNSAGTTCKVYAMPMNDGELDLSQLNTTFMQLARLPLVLIGIEWPAAFPGSFANVCRDAEIFGQQKGVLEAMAFCHKLAYKRISPQLWKGRLGLTGKEIDKGSKKACELWESIHPNLSMHIRGPRGGLLDGPLDACLIAEFMRTGLNVGRYSRLADYGKSLRDG